MPGRYTYSVCYIIVVAMNKNIFGFERFMYFLENQHETTYKVYL